MKWLNDDDEDITWEPCSHLARYGAMESLFEFTNACEDREELLKLMPARFKAKPLEVFNQPGRAKRPRPQEKGATGTDGQPAAPRRSRRIAGDGARETEE